MQTEILTGGHSASAPEKPRLLHGAWSELLAANHDLVEAGEAYCAVTRTSAGLAVGPLVLPRETACLRCVQRMIDLDAIDLRFVPAGAVSEAEAAAAREAVLGESALIGRMVLVDATSQAIGSIGVARFSNCADCRTPLQPTEVHYATQLFRKENG